MRPDLDLVTLLTLVGLAAWPLACTKSEVTPRPATASDPSTPAKAPEKGAEREGGSSPTREASSGEAPELRRIEHVGLSTPESILHDPGQDVYLVSNIRGSPLAKDDDGFISRVSPDGEVLDLEWISGKSDAITLNAPKGMAIARGLLWVSDIDHLRRFDLDTGAPRGAIAIEGATFLNDLAADDEGRIYVSDSGLTMGPKGFGPSGTDAIYRVDTDGTVTALIKEPSLGRPNGLLVEEARLWVATFGSGEIYAIPLGSKGARSGLRKLPAGSLDGILRAPDGRLLISSWEASAVFAGPPEGPFVAILEDLPSPADIGIDRKRGRLLIPLFKEDALVFATIPPAPKGP